MPIAEQFSIHRPSRTKSLGCTEQRVVAQNPVDFGAATFDFA